MIEEVQDGHRVQKVYDNQGRLRVCYGVDEKGVRAGRWETYYLTGEVCQSGFIQDGQPNGAVEMYDKDKNVLQRTTYKNGEWLSFEQYYEDKRLHHYHYKTREGGVVRKMYGRDGQLLLCERYNQAGQLHGNRVIYHPNGKEAVAEPYQNGVLDGIVDEYDVGGKLMSQTTFHAGCKNGEQKTYEGGVLISTNYFEQGRLSGQLVVDGRNSPEISGAYIR